jgi:hypothetical protein
MGGGHAMGGRGVGMGGHPMAGPARGPGFGAHPAFGSRPGFAGRPGGFVARPNTARGFGQFGNFGVNRGFHNGFHDHDRDRDRFGRFGYGYWPYNSYWPYWGWDWGSDYNNDYDTYLQQQANYNQQLALQGQVQYLQQQIAEMRHDQEVQRDYAEAEPAPTPPPPSAGTPAASKPHDDGPPTTLVFRDGKRVETQNYAIVGNTLWLMADNGHMQKVPLAELDREATLKSNEDRGVEFPLPKQQ